MMLALTSSTGRPIVSLRLPVNLPCCPGAVPGQSKSALSTCQLHQFANSDHTYIVMTHMGSDCCYKQQHARCRVGANQEKVYKGSVRASGCST
mgnify:CR=1 FL=1